MNGEEIQKKADEYRQTEEQLRGKIEKLTQELQQLHSSHQQIVGAMKASAELMILEKKKLEEKKPIDT